MRVTDIIDSKDSRVVALPPNATVLDLAQLLVKERIGAVVILEEDHLLGIVSERDVVRLVKEGRDPLSLVSTIMSANVRTCAPDEELRRVAEVMTNQRIRHLPVVDDGNVVAVISIGDVVKARLEDVEDERDHLAGYVHGPHHA